MTNYFCPQCGREKDQHHAINCYFEGKDVVDPVEIVEEKLWSFVLAGGGDGDLIRMTAAEIVQELGL